MVKTVLAPNAPWPKPVIKEPYKKKYKPKIKSDKVDENFDKWLTTITPVKPKKEKNA